MTPTNTIRSGLRALFKGFHQKQVVTLTALVSGLWLQRRAGVAAIGRALRTRALPKHAIKRVDRFLGNPRFDELEGFRRLLRLAMRGRTRLFFALDWTTIRDHDVLVASLIHKGRALPVFWQVLDAATLYKSQNAFEHGFCAVLKTLLPAGCRAVLLADRGFMRVEFARFVQTLGFDFVVRISGDVRLDHRDYRGPLSGLLTRRGQRLDLRGVQVRAHKALTARIVGVWEPRQQEAWTLLTNLNFGVARLVKLYGARFQIEESFRDQKSHRFGLSLGLLRMRQPRRLQRLLWVVVLLQWLATLAGLEAVRRGWDRHYRANTVRDRPTHSYFQLGMHYLPRLPCSPWRLLPLLHASTPRILWG